VSCPSATLLLLGLALAQPAVAQSDPPATQPEDPAYFADVEKACTARRYGLRLAAARKVGDAGAAAVDALETWEDRHGRNSLPVAVVEAVAERAGIEPAVLTLLEGWTGDRGFYWRAQALRGLAERAALPQLAERYLELFENMQNDPAWLVRVYARHGRWKAARALGRDLPDFDIASEPDPRARTRLAAMHGRLADLLEALTDERTFLGDPWGKRRAAEAFSVFRKRLDITFQPGAGYEENLPAIRTCADLVGALTGTEAALPQRKADPDVAFHGGIEVLSCRHGDMFLRWTADGRIFTGLETDSPRLVIEASKWRELSDSATALALPAQNGVVICDKLRIAPGPSTEQCQVAPDSLPDSAADWLKRLCAAIEEAQDSELAEALRLRLTQFAAR
jgi:hypothetical protein